MAEDSIKIGEKSTKELQSAES